MKMASAAELPTPGVPVLSGLGHLQPDQLRIMDHHGNAGQGQDSFEKSLGNGDKRKQACDEESAYGKFGWVTIGNCHIPYIFRYGEKYCAVRMVESKLLKKYLSLLHSDVYSCTCIRCFYITDVEARLLNEINVKHCEGQFGQEAFTVKDSVVCLHDAEEFYNFLDVCYHKLTNSSNNLKDKCGYVCVNGESVVPYTVHDSCRYVPMFYFEGEIDNLKPKAEKLEGWDLAYLKFCCKVQGIRNELFAGEVCSVVSLNDIKNYFPAGTIFEDYWPSKDLDTRLLLPSGKGIMRPGMWTKQPSLPPLQQYSPPNLTPVPQVVASPTSFQPPAAAIPPLTLTALPDNLSAASAVCNGLTHGTAHSPHYSSPAIDASLPQQQHTPPSSKSPPPPPLTPVNGTRYPTNMYSSGASVVDLPPLPQSHQLTVGNGQSSSGGSGSGSNTDPLRWDRRLVQLSAPPSGNHNPYRVQKALVEGKMVPCINSKPYVYSEFLMTLPDLVKHFFPSVSLRNCHQVLQEVLGMELHPGNKQQMTILRDCDGSQLTQDTLPLVLVRDVRQFLPQMKYMFSLMSAEGNPPKKQRTS